MGNEVERLSVLVIAGDGSSLEGMCQLLRAEGHRVRQTGSIYQGIALQARQPADVVLADGEEVTGAPSDIFQVLRESAPETFIVATFSALRRADSARALEAGADACLPDPFYFRELRSFLGQATRRRHDYVRREQQVAEKLDTMAHFVRQLAHEINNPLATVSGWIQIARADLKDDDPRRPIFQTIDQEVTRVASIIRRLQVFAGPTPADFQWLELNEVLEQALRREEAQPRPGFAIIREFAPELPKVKTDRTQLQQVCSLLVGQARDSAGPEGEIHVGTRGPGNGVVEITFQDNGPGIEEAQLVRVFDPFYSVNPGGNGSGLALSMCYGIVRSLGGRIEVESTRGNGTTFTVSLPVKE